MQEYEVVQGAMAQIGDTIRRSLGLWLCVVLGFGVRPSQAAAQDDSTSVGPPPHFAASWAPMGTLVDVSRMGVLRQRVSVDLTRVPLRQALAEIRDRAKIELAYDLAALPADRVVSLHANELTVASALGEVLLDTGLDVFMTRSGQLALLPCPHLPQPVAGSGEGVVAGRVVDRRTGVPLAGAAVMVEGTQLATTTNGQGKYRLAGLTAGTHALKVKFIGYTPASAGIAIGPNVAIHDFALEPSVQQLEQVVVTGTLVPTKVKALPTPITIITADDIRQQNVTRLAQLFRGQAANALAWDRPSDDHYNTISVRGATSLSTRSIKTFIDGIEVADPQFTALIDPNSIERIELTRGPQASAVYGSDAMGGVLQIFTKKGEFGLSRPGGDVKVSTGLIEKSDSSGVAARLETAVTLQGSERHTRYHVAGYYRRDGEWTPSYHNTNWSVTASAENVQGPVTSRISALFAWKTFDFPWSTALRDSGYAFFSKPFYQTIDLQTQTYGVNFVYTTTPWWRHDLVLGYDRWAFGLVQTQQRLTTPADTLLQVIMNQRGKMSVFYYTTVNAELSHAIGTTLTAGFNYYRLDGSDVFSSSTTTISGTLDGPASILRLPSTNGGYFAQAQVNINETAFLTAGLRAERSPGFGRDVGAIISPRFGASYVRPVGPVAVKLRASYGESVRAPEPSQNQAFLAAGFERLSNPALRPERQRGYDGGMDLSWGSRAFLSITYYDQNAIDLIDEVFGDVTGDPPRQQSREENVGRIKNRGWEIEGRYHLDRFDAFGTFSTTISRIQQLAPEYSGNYQVGDRPLDVPRYSAGLMVAYSLSPGTTFHGSMTKVGSWVERDLISFYGAVFGDAPQRPSDRDYWITYSGFTRFRIGFERKIWKSVSGTFDVENITNKRAFETDNVTAPPPRLFTLGLRTSY